MKHTKRQRKTRRGWQAHADWKSVAQATFLTTIGALTGGVASGQDVPPQGKNATPASVTDPQTAVEHFNIAAGELTTALEEFSRLTGVKVHSTIADDKLVGIRTKGVQGDFTRQQALSQLLSDTGLTGPV